MMVKKIGIYKSPGVYIKEVEISFIKPEKNYLRRKKISKLFNLPDEKFVNKYLDGF